MAAKPLLPQPHQLGQQRRRPSATTSWS